MSDQPPDEKNEEVKEESTRKHRIRYGKHRVVLV